MFRHLKVRIDPNKRPGRFIPTGSQGFSLLHGISESLAGRCGVLNMLNLSARELKDSRHTFDDSDCIFKGGYPELYERPEIDPHFRYGAYFSTDLERDVRNIPGEKCLMAGYIASRTRRPYPLSDVVHAAPGSFIDRYLD